MLAPLIPNVCLSSYVFHICEGKKREKRIMILITKLRIVRVVCVIYDTRVFLHCCSVSRENH